MLQRQRRSERWVVVIEMVTVVVMVKEIWGVDRGRGTR